MYVQVLKATIPAQLIKVNLGWLKALFLTTILTVAAAWQAGAQVTLVPANSVWKYLDNGSDQGSFWTSPAYDDLSWASGPAELGYGDGGEATTNSFGPAAANKYITTYY